MKKEQAAYIFARIITGGIFIYTGMIHLSDPEGFSKAVQSYELLPAGTVGIFSLVLPLIELLAGLSVFAGIFIRAGSLSTSFLLGCFTTALAISLYRGLDISCGCFTTAPDADKISWIDLARDTVLFLVSAFVVALSFRTNRVPLIAPKERIVLPVLAALLISGILLMQLIERDPCENVSMEAIGRHKPYPSGFILSKRPVHGFCEVIVQEGDKKIPMYYKEDFIITGEMVDDKKSITKEGFLHLISKDFFTLRSQFDSSVAIHYVPQGETRHTLYMFASPGCPNCKEALMELLPVLDQTRTELKILILAKGSMEDLAIKTICRKMDLDTYIAKKWLEVAEDGKRGSCPDGLRILASSNELGVKFGVKAVPVFITDIGIILSANQLPTVINLLKN